MSLLVLLNVGIIAVIAGNARHQLHAWWLIVFPYIV